MPRPTTSHLRALSLYLDKVYSDVALSDEDASARKSAVDKLEHDIQEHSSLLKGLSLFAVGDYNCSLTLCKHCNIHYIFTAKELSYRISIFLMFVFGFSH